jgi:hypothetical protein
MKLSDLPLDQEAIIRKLFEPRYAPATTNRHALPVLHDRMRRALPKCELHSGEVSFFLPDAWNALIALAAKVLKEESR